MCDPLVIHWPKGIERGARCAASITTAPTSSPRSYECCGITPPDTVLGYEQSELPGVSMRYSFDAPDAPTEKHIQYYEMLGTRGIWRDGWKAVTEHAPMPSDKGHFDQDALAAVSHRRGPVRGHRRVRAAPRQGEAARRPVV